MDLDLTFEQLVEFPNQIIEQTRKYGEVLDYLSKEEMNKYDYKMILEKITNSMAKFKDAKFKYKFPLEDSISIPSSVGIKIPSKKISDKVGDAVSNYVDKQLWVKQIYYALLKAAPKLNRTEAIYFVDSFFKGYSEEVISEKLRMNRVTLRNKVKKSCIIKLWIELEPLFSMED